MFHKMVKSAEALLIIFLSLSDYITCNKQDDEIKAALSTLLERMGSCSEYFEFKRIDDFINGNLILLNIKKGDKVQLAFSVNEYEDLDSGILLPDGSSEEIVQRVRNGQPISYRVDFPLVYSSPYLVNISINEIELCTTEFFYSSNDVEFVLQHTMNIINNSVSVFTTNINLPNFAEGLSCGLADTKVTINGVTPLTYGLTEMRHGGHPWPSAIHERQASLMASVLTSMTSARTLCGGNHYGFGPCEGKSRGFTLNHNGCWMPPNLVAAGLVFQQCSKDLQQDTVYCDISRHMSRLEKYITQQEQPVIGSLEEICGMSGTRSRTKHPWLVAVYVEILSGVLFSTSGILISSKSVLITMKYDGLVGKNMKDFLRIHLGRYDLSSMEENGVVTRDIENIIFHPYYQNSSFALLRMKTPVGFTQYVIPICLSAELIDGQLQFEEKVITLINYQLIEVAAGNYLNIPQSKEVNSASIQQCEHRADLPKHQFCIPSPELQWDMLIIERNQRWFLHGVYSGEFDNSAVYANITEYQSWILNSMF